MGASEDTTPIGPAYDPDVKPYWKRGPPPVKGAKAENVPVYRKILATIDYLTEWEGRGPNPSVKQRELRWLLAKPDTDLFGAKDPETADKKLALRLGNGDPEAGEVRLASTKAFLRVEGIAPLAEEEHCSRQDFTRYLTRLVEHGHLLRTGRGTYRRRPLSYAADLVDDGINDRVLGDRRKEVRAFNLPEELSDREGRLLGTIGDLMALLADVAANIVGQHRDLGSVPPGPEDAFLLMCGGLPRREMQNLNRPTDPSYEDLLEKVGDIVGEAAYALGGEERQLEGGMFRELEHWERWGFESEDELRELQERVKEGVE